MHKDDALRVVNEADNMTLEALLVEYTKFQAQVDNTPLISLWYGDEETRKDNQWSHGLHSAMGLSTEANEILDEFKKDMFGKKRPVNRHALVEESGDVFYYFNQLLTYYNITLIDVVRDNVKKLANRYIERFEV